MNIREFILPALLSMATMFALQYFFSGKTAAPDMQQRSGASFLAPTTQQQTAPLNKEVDFIDKEKVAREEKTEVINNDVTLVFSTAGATLERLSFKRELLGRPGEITTVFPGSMNDREKRCFLVALGNETPFGYQLVKRTDSPEVTELLYRSVADAGVVEKLFTIVHGSYKIGLSVTITPKSTTQPVQARVLFPAPMMPDIEATDIISAVVSNEKGAVEKTVRNKVVQDRYWFAPWLFGTDSKYYTHVMVNDPNNFAQRTYYNLLGVHSLIAIIEGPTVTQKTTWQMSFYCGPKEEPALAAVDPRLVDILDYSGWLAPISHMMMRMLKLLYGYVRNYGLAIILLTLLIKLLLLPFSLKAERNVKAMGAYKKKLAYIEQKYKHDREALAQAKLAFMKEHGLAGMGLSGCLPLLIQIPMFFGLSRVLNSSIEFYQASFLWIPDLASRDPWFILPFLVAIPMIMKSSVAPADQRTWLVVTGLVFGAASANFSAGLALYFVINTMFDSVQSLLNNRVKA